MSETAGWDYDPVTNSAIQEKRGQAFWITSSRPDKRNAINADVVAGIAQ